jgi:hypothetical protein
LRVLGAVQGGGAEALAVQKAACKTLYHLTWVAANKVRGLVAGRSALDGCDCWVPAVDALCCGCVSVLI